MPKENQIEMSEDENATAKAERVVKYNEKFNIPEQTEKEEAETHENSEVEHLADDKEIERRKKPS
jgi:hypothetical protein